MAKRQSMKDIAEAAGVSIATVSRVLNKKPDVNEETRERVENVLRSSDYEYPSNSVETDHKIIGFVNMYRRYSMGTDYVAQLLNGCQQRAGDHAYTIAMIEADAVQKEMRWPGRYSIMESLSGVVWSMPVFQAPHREFLEQRGIPYVVINNLQHGVKAPLIESDNLTAIRQGVEYLVGMGHREIGFVGGALEIANMSDRYNGYLQHMKEFGLEIDRDWIIDDLAGADTESALEGTYRLIGRRKMPTALICVSESVALGVYEALRYRGFCIPDDVSVIAFDDSPLSRMMQPPITTFRQPLDSMGAAAIDILMDIIHLPGGPENQHVREPLTLIVRDSVAAIGESASPLPSDRGLPASPSTSRT